MRSNAHLCSKAFWRTRMSHTYLPSRACSALSRRLYLIRRYSAQEQEIIENTSSCYVIGRSGTGKTTTMLFKMLGIERAWKQFPDMWDKPRQVFVTQSRVLATKVEEYFSRLILSVEVASYSPEELRKMSRSIEKEMQLIDLDDEILWRPDLPTKFSELNDDNFPLFITYDQVCEWRSVFSALSFTPISLNVALPHASE